MMARWRCTVKGTSFQNSQGLRFTCLISFPHLRSYPHFFLPWQSFYWWQQHLQHLSIKKRVVSSREGGSPLGSYNSFISMGIFKAALLLIDRQRNCCLYEWCKETSLFQLNCVEGALSVFGSHFYECATSQETKPPIFAALGSRMKNAGAIRIGASPSNLTIVDAANACIGGETPRIPHR